jgi:hypothetical protein
MANSISRIAYRRSQVAVRRVISDPCAPINSGDRMAFRFEGLEIWHKARDFSSRIYEVTAKFPSHEL